MKYAITIKRIDKNIHIANIESEKEIENKYNKNINNYIKNFNNKKCYNNFSRYMYDGDKIFDVLYDNFNKSIKHQDFSICDNLELNKI